MAIGDQDYTGRSTTDPNVARIWELEATINRLGMSHQRQNAECERLEAENERPGVCKTGKADRQAPTQTFMVFDQEYGKVLATPIFVGV